jgi:hypothetical protein
VIFTALPQGFQDGEHGRSLRLLAFVSPRLYTDEGLPAPKLGQFPDFVDWPSTRLSWEVGFDGHPPMPATVTSPPPLAAAWAAVFSADSYVQPYQYQSFAGRVTRSYPQKVVRQFVVDLYAKVVAMSPISFPPRQALVAAPVGPPGELNAIAFGRTGSVAAGQGRLAADGEVEALSAINGFLSSQLVARAADLDEMANAAGTTPNGVALLQAKRFLYPRTPPPPSGNYSDLSPLPPPAPPGTVVPSGQLPPDIVDFHQVIAGLGDHGALLRALGLVVELVVPVPPGPSPSAVRLVPSWTPKLKQAPPATATVTVAPSTLLDGGGWPAPRLAATPMSAGHMQFNLKDDFTPIEVDTDSAGLKLLDLARTLWRLEVNGTATPSTPPTSSLPSLRQGGIAVAQADRAWALANPATGLLANADAMNAGVEATPAVSPVVGAEDLSRGLRVDIYDERRNRWFQLCARSAPDAYGAARAPGGYVLGRGRSQLTVPVPAGDEGHVSMVTTSDSTPGGPSDLYLHEILFHWDGWSLVGSRPGKTLGEGPGSEVSNQPANLPAPNSNFPVRIDYVATPGTLPLLRFGRTYRARARVADLAGGGPGFDPAPSPGSFQYATESITYGRFEPVPPPVMLMRSPVTEGERLERLVVRSNYDIADDRAGTSNPRITPCVRHVAAPATAELLAEQHGAFDRFARLQASSYDLIKERANANIGDVGTNRATEDPGLPSQHGPGQTSGLYYDTDDLVVPYLPDVLARRASFSALPGTVRGQVVQVPFFRAGNQWPASSAFELRVVGEGPRPPVVINDGGRAVLTVSLPKAATVEVQLASTCEPSDLDVLGLWGWFKQSGTATAALERAALDGLVWLLTPPRSVVLVHAVRQPLQAPAFSPRFAIERALNATTATLSDPGLSVHRASSAKLDIGASWQEWVDNGQNANPDEPVPTSAPAGEVSLASSGGDKEPLNVVQRFNDTKGRQVAYTLTATTRFAAYFAEKVPLDLEDTPTRIDPRGVMPGSVVVTGLYRGTEHTFIRGEDFSTDDAVGTLQRLPGGKLARGQKVTVGFVPLPVTRSSLEGHPESYPGVVRYVPSTARPAAPNVLYALPAWSFSGPSRQAEVLESRRLGGVLRVYLRRPWWSSGGGEQLGVLLADANGTSVSPYFTQWGADPLWKGYSLSSSGAPVTANFPLAVTVIDGGIVLEEAAGTYGLAGHEVHFDPDRNLWYCDIQLTTGLAYFPFTRLALVRYQPNSVDGAHVSRVVVSDCAQTVPNRSTTVDLSVPGTVTVTVSGVWYQTGPTSGGNQGPGLETGYMYAQFERQTPGLSDELSWLPAGDELALAPTTDLGPTGLTLWSGSLTRPKAPGTYRVVVWEQQSWPSTSPPSAQVSPRVVFFDAIPI